MESNGKIMATKNIIYWCCPRPRPAIFHLASRGLHTASVKFASGDISAAQRTLAPVLNDDWSKPCCMSNNYKSNTMPPVQKYCHIMIFLSSLVEKMKGDIKKLICHGLSAINSILPHTSTMNLQVARLGFSGRQETAQAVDRGGSWLGGTAGWHSWHHSTRQDVTAISTSIKTGLYSRHSCHRPSCRWP